MSRKHKRELRRQQQAAKPGEPTPPSDPPKAKRGRPPIFGPTICAAIVGHVRKGLAYKHAAEREGITERTLYEWLERGRREPDGPHAEFSQDIKDAAAEFAGECVGHIKAAAPDQWQAAAWLLERKHPAEFASERVRLKALETQVATLLAKLAEAETARDGTGGNDVPVGVGGGADRPPDGHPPAA